MRGFLIIALIAAVVVVLSLEEVLATVGGLLQIAFFLAIAFFLFLLWRDRRSDIEAWADLNQKVFYGAVVLAVVDIGAFIGLHPVGPRRAGLLPRARRVRLRGGPHLARGAPLRLRRAISTPSWSGGKRSWARSCAPRRLGAAARSRGGRRRSRNRQDGALDGRRRGGRGARLPGVLLPPVRGGGALLVLGPGRPAGRIRLARAPRAAGAAAQGAGDCAGPLGLRGPDRGDLVAFGFLNALQRLSDESPLLLAVDDVQWLDQPSLALLQYALPRLDRAPIAVLTARGKTPSWLSRIEGLIELDLRPLSVGALHELLRARLDAAFSRPVLLRIWETSGETILVLCAGARPRAPTSWRPNRARSETARTRNSRGALLERLETLTPEALAVCRVVAASSEPTLRLVELVVDQSAAGVDDAFRARVLELDGERLRFTHPLLASAITGRTVGEAKRTLHERLAAVALDPEEQARHLALGASAPNAKVAAALDAAAWQARDRGAATAAAELAEPAPSAHVIVACRAAPARRALRRGRPATGAR